MGLTIIIIACIYFAAFWKAEADTIQFRPERAIFQNDWWLNKKDGNKRSWLMKYPLAAFNDGWHFSIAAMLFCFFFLISFLLIIIINISISWIFLIILAQYVIFGIVFNLNYDDNFSIIKKRNNY